TLSHIHSAKSRGNNTISGISYETISSFVKIEPNLLCYRLQNFCYSPLSLKSCSQKEVLSLVISYRVKSRKIVSLDQLWCPAHHSTQRCECYCQVACRMMCLWNGQRGMGRQ